MSITSRKMGAKIQFSRDVEKLFKNIIIDFPTFRERIYLQNRKKIRDNIKAKKRWNAKRRAARLQKE